MCTVDTAAKKPNQVDRSRLPRNAALMATRIEREAWHDIACAGTRAAPRFALETQAFGETLVLRSGALDSLLFNRVIGLGNRGAVAEVDIDAILRGYGDRGIDRYWIHVDGIAGSGQLAERLAARGLECHSRRWAKFMRDVTPYRPGRSKLGLRRAARCDAGEIAAIVAPSFDLPAPGGVPFAALIDRRGWHLFVATADDRVAAVAGLYVSGAVGYHAFAATRPELRNQGAQSLLIQARIETARALGCRWVVTETGAPRDADEANPSFQNIERAGFTPVGCRLNFGLPGTTWAAPDASHDSSQAA